MPLPHAPTSDEGWSALLGPVADATIAGLMLLDAGGVVRATNLAARRIFGHADDAVDPLVGHSPAEATLEELDGRPTPPDQEPVALALRTGEAQRDRLLRLTRLDGVSQYLNVTVVPLFARDEADRPYGVVVSFVDVTAFMEAQAALDERERELALLADHAGDLIARHDGDGRILYAAGGAEGLLGRSAAQLVGSRALDVCHPDDVPALRRAEELARAGRSNVVAFRLRHPRDGHEIWLESTVHPILDERGAFVEYISTTRDVSARQAAEQELRETREAALRGRALLEEAQQIAGMGSWSIDLDSGDRWRSDTLLRIFGFAPGSHPTTAQYRQLVHPDDAEGLLAAVRRTAEERIPFEHTYRLIRTDGAERIMLSRGAPAHGAGDRRRVSGTTQDVTDMHALRTAARETERRFRAAFDHAPIGMCMVGLSAEQRGRWLSVNAAMTTMLGWERDELLGLAVRTTVHPDERENADRDMAGLLDGTLDSVQDERRLLHRDGHSVWAIVTTTVVRDEERRPLYAVVQFVDITERKHAEGRLRHLADHDTLTGLLNRRRFEAELDRVLSESERYGRSGAVLVLDLDGFKDVNDTLGHRAGDELIARLAASLRTELRESDVLARLGGDEFGVILPAGDRHQAAAVAEKLRRAVQRDGTVTHDGRQARVTASVGVASFTGGDGLGAEELLVEADIAMYDAKEAGRNRAVHHAPTSDGRGRHVSRLSWLERIRTALDEERLELHAQPIVALAGDHDVPAFELLVRMRSDGGELVPPAAFLPTAERHDLIQEVDRWVVGRALDLMAREHAAGHDLSLAVNLSGRTMGDAAFAAWLEERLAATPPPPRRLVFEITETAAIINVDRARALAAMLRRHGCLLALDDFGAGFASLSYLKHLQFDVVKIDGDYVRGLRDNPTDRLVVEAVVAIARGLGTPSLAEFVTDADTLDAVRALGVDYAQGFHLGRPAPVDEALRAARARSRTGQRT